MAPERTLLPEAEPLSITPHERHFGNIEFQTLELNGLIIFSQIRDKINPRFHDLEESIDNDDLDNPINIARMTESELQDYIDFTNKTWGADTSIIDFLESRQADGRYNVVVAGHSRTLSMKNIAQKHTDTTGQPTNYTVLCKIEKDNSVESIVTKQFLENIHAAVPKHREAEAIIEMYQQGLGKPNKWNSPEEFRQQHSISKSVLEQALAYGELPLAVRQLVTCKYLHYQVAVELGRTQKLLQMHKALSYDLPVECPLPKDLQESIEYRLMGICMMIRRERFSIIKAVGHIRQNIVVGLQSEIATMSGLKDMPAACKRDVALDIDAFMITPEQQQRMDRDRERKRAAKEADEILSQPHFTTASIVNTLVGDDAHPLFETVINDAEKALNVLVGRRIGSSPAIGAAALSDEDQLGFAI